MVDTTDNLLKEENGVTITEVQEALAEAEKVNSELRMKLDKIKIQINGRDNPELINAIKTILNKVNYEDRDSRINFTVDPEIVTSAEKELEIMDEKAKLRRENSK